LSASKLEPILDKYGFKDSFFGVCTWVGKTKDSQTWQYIAGWWNWHGIAHHDACSSTSQL